MRRESDPRFLCFLSIVAAMALAGCSSAPQGPRIDNVPMYGQPALQRPEILKKADEDFIKQAGAAAGNRETASKLWFQQAEKFFSERNFDFAMRRYNQSWLLDPNNYQPYWGFGRVMMEQNKVDEGIGYLEKSLSLCNDAYQKVALLSDMGAAYMYKAISLPAGDRVARERYFQIANQHFVASTTLDAGYADSWRRWSFSLYREEKYAESWEKLKKARQLGAKNTETFAKALEQKMPEPR
jgi:tetratricopeptide (TPR) repeat protein